jgi:hypothetical protein
VSLFAAGAAIRSLRSVGAAGAQFLPPPDTLAVAIHLLPVSVGVRVAYCGAYRCGVRRAFADG